MELHKLTHAALFKALEGGDMATVAAYFEQCHVRADVAETEARIAVDPIRRLVLRRPTGGSFFPWYCIPTRSNFDCYLTVFDKPNKAAYFDVVRWFYSSERLAFMSHALGRLLPTAAKIAIRTAHYDALELLLSPRVWNAVMPANFQQETLNSMLTEAVGRDNTAVKILIAHGADVNDGSLRQRDLVDQGLRTLVEEGGFVVGTVLREPILYASVESTRFLLEHGADFGMPTDCCGVKGRGHTAVCECGGQLHAAVAERQSEMVELFVVHSFMDVDMRDSQGDTPLMKLPVGANRAMNAVSEEILITLLEARAHVSLDDLARIAVLMYGAFGDPARVA